MGVGDLMLTTPTIKKIKEINPEAYVGYATYARYVGFMRHVDIVDEVIDLEDVDARDWDICCDWIAWSETSPLRYTIPRMDLFAARAGVSLATDRQPVYHVTDDELAWAKSVTATLGSPIVAITPIGSTAVRTYPHYRRLIDILLERGKSVVLLHDRPIDVDKNTNSFLNMSGKLSLAESIAILAVSDCLVSPDSGFVHVAAALDIPTVAIFGTIDHRLRTLFYPLCNVIQINDEIGCPHATIKVVKGFTV